eukprot:CAMPEP_0185463582 /NCGR_PEP_ID=MMETSP1365-20130426/95302_1 /TAXON_ID=38817 /ORGANISM="Gephyrocapsa oceanica, Strain RCC1303" /LENGTH=70 /DNA_ID=CAMNT_0028070319 /DNA_START=39 /DNA_END=248 /DNA_ORIENTATION=+
MSFLRKRSALSARGGAARGEGRTWAVAQGTRTQGKRQARAAWCGARGEGTPLAVMKPQPGRTAENHLRRP